MELAPGPSYSTPCLSAKGSAEEKELHLQPLGHYIRDSQESSQTPKQSQEHQQMIRGSWGLMQTPIPQL